MLTFWNHASAFWTVVVMNCIQPVNWEHCLPVQDWLFPGIQEGIEIYLNPSSLYKNEREHLLDINIKK
tara:strand:+ start:1836 stop:2039 length:204 start_codon:yes stop_codon:yes gene_type:complete